MRRRKDARAKNSRQPKTSRPSMLWRSRPPLSNGGRDQRQAARRKGPEAKAGNAVPNEKASHEAGLQSGACHAIRINDSLHTDRRKASHHGRRVVVEVIVAAAFHDTTAYGNSGAVARKNRLCERSDAVPNGKQAEFGAV
jgi:hypothetical protein